MSPTRRLSEKAGLPQGLQNCKVLLRTEHGEKVRKATTGNLLLCTARFQITILLDANTRLPRQLVFRQMDHGYLGGDAEAHHAITLERWSKFESGEAINLTDTTIVDLPISLRVVGELPE